MGEETIINLQTGAVINNRYEVVRCLGTGSMGLVYACRHKELGDHMVAMKVLFSNVARDEVAFARFKNEIVASYGVNHPNVVRAYEYFKEGDMVAYTMEYVDGGDLADKMNECEIFEIDECIRLLKQTCSGLIAIHEAGIIHRDLKPENILLDKKGNVKITDLGIARTQKGPRLTEHGGVVGTMQYVSPEYLEEGVVDESSDIYALGVIAYEMIVGDEPFQGETAIEQMTLRLRSDPDPLYLHRSDCPAPLSNIVLKAMARNTNDRYSTAAEMLKDLEALSKGGAVVAEEELIDEIIFTPEAGEEDFFIKSETLEMDEDLVSKIREETSIEAKSWEEYEQEENQAESENENVPYVANVSISQSRLSNDRIKELSRDFYAEEDNSFIKSILIYGFFLVFGLSLALYGLYSLKPGAFAGLMKYKTHTSKSITEKV